MVFKMVRDEIDRKKKLENFVATQRQIKESTHPDV
jgi:hypothetical protein